MASAGLQSCEMEFNKDLQSLHPVLRAVNLAFEIIE